MLLLFTGCPDISDPPENPNCSIVVEFEDLVLEVLVREKINKPDGDIYACDVENITMVTELEENGV